MPVSVGSGGRGELELPSAKSLPVQAATDSGLLLEASSADKFEMTLHRDAKFWDAVSNRKLKAKKRKARKFLSHQQERFSIGDEFKGDEDGATEVNFYSSFTAGAGSSSQSLGPEGSANNYSSLSDMDLIMQLAELENGNAEEVNFPMNAGKETGGKEVSTVETETTPTTSDAAKAGRSAVSSELQVLEELERELGLDNFLTGGPSSDPSQTVAPVSAGAGTAASTGSVSAPVTSSVSTLDDDDNLDELEKYLQSLGTKS